MDYPWWRKLFCHSRKHHRPENTQTKADNGDAEAQYNLGSTFADGERKAPDYPEAVRWYLKAADQDHALAQFSLGMLFADGQGVPRDDSQAMLWIGRAAQQGHAGAQHNLGSRCRRASFDRSPKDAEEFNLEAYKWFCLATAQGYKGSDAVLERITLGMTREQVSEGTQRAAAFIPSRAKAVQV